MKRLLSFLLAILIAFSIGFSDASAKSQSNQKKFDYYLLSLSWSPQYCADTGISNGDPQCKGRRLGFVVHGLWPQYSSGGYPQSCAKTPPVRENLVNQMIDIMPSEKLIQHEWEKHGTCSGLTVDKYFSSIRSLYNSLNLPPEYIQPTKYSTKTVQAIEDDLVENNPTLSRDAIAVQCKRQYLKEVQICYSTDLKPRACGKGVTDRCRASVVLRPAD
ncbi:hypothetical protein TUMEXPCC7403_02125 [Tumidithrix helvetica PCC 7403]|uniref:ribonuclease T2 family protein n=1 Tax=Tumidithrix helvetica TaxID=3457545 RepID=UPI003CAF39DF